MKNLLKMIVPVIALAVIGLALKSGIPSLWRAEAAEHATVSVDWQTRFQTMEGFGTSARMFDDPHMFENFNKNTGRALTVVTRKDQDLVLDALYRDLRLTRLRPVFNGRDVEPHNDNDDPNLLDSSRLDFSWKRNDAAVYLALRAAQRGVTTVYPTSLAFQSWIKDESQPAEVAELILARVMRWRQLGMDLAFYSVINEPGYRRGGYWSGAFIRDVIKIAGPRLRQNGFATKFVVPDDWSPKEAFERSQVILADPEARKYVGALAYHLYSGSAADMNDIKALGQKHGLPIWVTEYSAFDKSYWRRLYRKSYEEPLDWAVLIDDLIVKYGVSAIDYTWGYFGQWEPASTNLLQLRNSGAHYQGFKPSREYFATRQYSRYVRPGARRAAAVSSDPAIRVSAFAGKEGWTLVLINTGNTTKSVALRFGGGGPDEGAVFGATRTTRTESGARLASLKLRSGGFEASLPPASITTFTTLEPGG